MISYIPRNTLLSAGSINKALMFPKNDEACSALVDLFMKFQDMRQFASEIHTETHLVKPMLRTLGYFYESKPKFFELSVKGPDAALFRNEQEMLQASKSWGTEEYYTQTLGIALLKRYGRTLIESVGGFFLDFENKIPLYQLFYLLKKTKTPWGILTNGKSWILMKRPVNNEFRVLEIDLEKFLDGSGDEVFHIFFALFSLYGLNDFLPRLIEEDREELTDFLVQKKRSLNSIFTGEKKKTDAYPSALDYCRELYSGDNFPATEAFLKEKGVPVKTREYQPMPVVTNWNRSEITSYLFNKRESAPFLDLEETILGEKNYTKEGLLSLKILDMTPGFGSTSTQLVENIAYMSFLLPYQEKNTFISDWENERRLKRYIVNNNLYGIERSHFSLDITKNCLRELYESPAPNYRLGNPLIGMSIKDLLATFDDRNQLGLFNKHPQEVVDEVTEMYRSYCSLSEKIKEDAVTRDEIKAQFNILMERIADTLDIMTSTYFHKKIENKKLQEMLMSLSGDASTWNNFRNKDWFQEAKEVAKRNAFFHMEIEFPFLLGGAFDYIFVQPSTNYLWEDEFPLSEVTKAYIKRGMQYLKDNGRFVIISNPRKKDLSQKLQSTKRYKISNRQEGLIILEKMTK